MTGSHGRKGRLGSVTSQVLGPLPCCLHQLSPSFLHAPASPTRPFLPAAPPPSGPEVPFLDPQVPCLLSASLGLLPHALPGLCVQPNRPQPGPTSPSPRPWLMREKACPFSWGPFPTGHQGSGLGRHCMSLGRLTSQYRGQSSHPETRTLRTLRLPSQGQSPVLSVPDKWWPSLFPNTFATGSGGQRSGPWGPARPR